MPDVSDELFEMLAFYNTAHPIDLSDQNVEIIVVLDFIRLVLIQMSPDLPGVKVRSL